MRMPACWPRGLRWSRGLCSSNPAFQDLSVRITGRRADLTLNRPKVRNALRPSMLTELTEACSWLNLQSEVRVVIIRGAGDSFCAGMDVGAGMDVTDHHALGKLGFDMAAAVESLDAIAIAACTGHVVGGGMVLASACDLRVASDDVKFSLPEVALGVPLTWGGTHRLLMDLGLAKCKELILTGRAMRAAEAHACGFINARAGSHEQLSGIVDDLAGAIASRPRHAVTLTKRGANAIAARMVGLEAAAYSDASVLAAGMGDAEGQQAREAYVAALHAKRG